MPNEQQGTPPPAIEIHQTFTGSVVDREPLILGEQVKQERRQREEESRQLREQLQAQLEQKAHEHPHAQLIAKVREQLAWLEIEVRLGRSGGEFWALRERALFVASLGMDPSKSGNLMEEILRR